jgi:hypothetical protein
MVRASTGVVDCDEETSGMPLALRFAEAVRNAAGDPTRRPVLERLRGTVVIVVDDDWMQFTLRFDYGRVGVHAGVVGVPDITVRGPTAELEALIVRPFTRRWAGLLPRALGEFMTVRALVSAWARRSVKVYGAVLRPRLFLQLLLLLSAGAVAPTAAPRSSP